MRIDRRSAVDVPLDLHVEIIGGLLLLLIATALPHLGVTSDIAWFLGVMAVLLPLSAATIKAYVAKAIRNQGAALSDGPGRAATLVGKIALLPEPHASFARDVLREAVLRVERIENGVVSLTEADYFDHIIEETRKLGSGHTLIAVNAFAEGRWVEDPREALFLEENRRAVERGATIQRLFITDSFQPSDHKTVPQRVVQLHVDAGIAVGVVLRKALLGKSELMKDWTLFDGQCPRLYVDYQDPVDPTRVERGELYLDSSDHERQLRHFRVLQEHALPEREVRGLLRSTGAHQSGPIPQHDEHGAGAAPTTDCDAGGRS